MFELLDIRAGYGSVTVLEAVHLVVPSSTVVGLIGANGAGKTTTLRVASGRLHPRAGRVVMRGEDLTGSPPNVFAGRGVCHVPEGGGVFGSMTVRENLLLQSVAGGEDSALDRASEAFPVLGKRLSQLARTLSGGEQRMLALARAYVQSPSVVLLDEVSLGLAPKIVDEVYGFLGRLAGQGVALVVVEQYINRVMNLVDFIYILNRGRVVFAGEPSELSEEQVFEEYIGMSSSS